VSGLSILCRIVRALFAIFKAISNSSVWNYLKSDCSKLALNVAITPPPYPTAYGQGIFYEDWETVLQFSRKSMKDATDVTPSVSVSQ
jgi:hypothetical protein